MGFADAGKHDCYAIVLAPARVRRESIYNPEQSQGEEEAFYDAVKPSWFHMYHHCSRRG